MNAPARHTWIVGAHSANRARAADSISGPAVSVSCHRRLRGTYSGVSAALEVLVGDAYARWPGVVDEHRVSLLYAAPDLSALIGSPLASLTSSTPHEERTRFFGEALARCVSHGVVNFLIAYGQRHAAQPLALFFDDVHHADPTEQEFLALALRRVDPGKIHLMVGTAVGCALDGALAEALRRHARPAEADESPAPPATGDQDELTRAFIASDGTSDDPWECAAYERSAPALRASLHDERADELEARGGWSVRLGALPYHREHGTDRRGAGCRALLSALEYCLATGFYPALLDLGERGRAIADPETQQQEYCQFTAKAAGALVALGRPADAERMYLGLRERYALPRVHMSTSYNLAMLYTRWYAPQSKNHNLAKVFCNNAIALATAEPDPQLRAFFSVFQHNGLALVEMHRGNPELALDLVTNGIQRLDEELPAGKFLVHRSQLLHNRARVLSALGRVNECLEEFGKLVAIDPNHAEYFIDRGNVLRRQGDDDAALADYERARLLSPPFPEVYYNLGDVRAALGDLAGAIADFGYVVEMDPDHLDARISLIELLMETGDVERAAAEVDEALGLHEDSAALFTLAGLIALDSADAVRARERLDQAVRSDPDFAPPRVHRAMLAAGSAEHELAVADLTHAMAALGEDPDLLYQRALCHLALGDRAHASEDLKALVALGESPYGDDARAQLAEMTT